MDTPDNKFYIDGANRMIEEGLDLVGNIIKFMQESESELNKLSREDRKRFIIKERPLFETFAQVHPIVFEFIVSEKTFNASAFRRYVRAVFGRPKSKEDQALISKDNRNVYYIKNKQHALYYKYLYSELHPHCDMRTVNNIYHEALEDMNKKTKQMLEQFELAQKQVENKEHQLTEEKRAELASRLLQSLSQAN